MFIFRESASSIRELESKVIAAADALRRGAAIETTTYDPDDDDGEEADAPNPLFAKAVANRMAALIEPTILGQPMPSGDIEVDSKGMPWDARIHSTNKGRSKDGSWRLRRNVDESLVTQIEGELRGAPSAPSPQVPSNPFGQTAPVLNVVPVAASQSQAAPHRVVPTQAPVAQVAQPAYENIPIPATQKPAHTLETFKSNLIVTMSGLVISGKLTPEYVESLKAYFKVKEIWEVGKDEVKVSELFESLVHYGMITKVG